MDIVVNILYLCEYLELELYQNLYLSLINDCSHVALISLTKLIRN